MPALLRSSLPSDQIPHPQLARAHSSPGTSRSRECAVPYLVYSPRRLPGWEGVPGSSVNAAAPTAYLCTFTPQLHPQALNLNTTFKELNFLVFPHQKVQSLFCIKKHYCFLSDTVSKAQRHFCRLWGYFLKGDFKRLAKIQVQVSFSQDS